jgi:hypothetical protein
VTLFFALVWFSFTWMSCSAFALSNHFFVLTCCQSAPQGEEIWKIKLIWTLIYGDERLTSVLVRVLWRFVLSILVWWLLGIACW